MLTGRTSVDEIASHFTRSQECYNLAGADPPQFVRTLYRSMLNRKRPPDVAYWTPVVQSSGNGFVAHAIYQTYESGVIRVNRVYVLVLETRRRPCRSGELGATRARAGGPGGALGGSR